MGSLNSQDRSRRKQRQRRTCAPPSLSSVSLTSPHITSPSPPALCSAARRRSGGAGSARRGLAHQPGADRPPAGRAGALPAAAASGVQAETAPAAGRGRGGGTLSQALQRREAQGESGRRGEGRERWRSIITGSAKGRGSG